MAHSPAGNQRSTVTSRANTYTAFDQVFSHLRYPAGESHVALEAGASIAPGTTIEMPVHGFDDLGQLITADHVLQRNDIHVEWFVPYFPFARHDRRNHQGDGFELGVALEMMRDINIVIADPHSDVAGQLRHIPQAASVECFQDAGHISADAIVVVPDAGATKKAHEWATGPLVQALKHRDTTTGRLSGFEVLTKDLGGRPCIIVDDICDGGGTFLGLAKALAAKNAGPLTLAVTHRLFTKGTATLRRSYDHIVTFGFAGGPRVDGIDYLPFEYLYNKGARR